MTSLDSEFPQASEQGGSSTFGELTRDQMDLVADHLELAAMAQEMPSWLREFLKRDLGLIRTGEFPEPSRMVQLMEEKLSTEQYRWAVEQARIVRMHLSSLEN